jgi:hypothetical protein
MATVASLNVALKATTGGFASGMRKASSALDGFMSGIGGLKGAVGGLAAIFAGNEIVQFVGRQMEAIDTSAKLADSLNADIATLEAYQYSASLAGSSTEEFNKALQKQTLTIGDAMAGGKAQQDAFASLGLDAGALSQMDSTSAFAAIAESISKIENPAKRASLAVDIFGKSGAKLIPTLMQGKAGLAASAEEYKKLAGEINRVDAAQIEAANDALSKIGVAVSGIGRAIAIEVAPYITTLADEVLTLSGRFTDMRSAAKEAAVSSVTGFGYAYDAVQFFATGINVVRAALAKLIGLYASFVSWMISNGSKIAAFLGFENVSASLGEVSTFVEQIGQGFSETGDKFLDMATDNAAAFGKGTAAADRFREAIEKTKTTIILPEKPIVDPFAAQLAYVDKLKEKAAKAFEDMKKKAASIFEGTRTPMEEFTTKLDELMGLGFEGLLDPETIARAGKQALDQLASTLPTFSGAGGLRQIDTSLMSVQGLQQQAKDTQEVYSPQLDVANKQLMELNKQFKGLTLGAVAQ